MALSTENDLGRDTQGTPVGAWIDQDSDSGPDECQCFRVGRQRVEKALKKAPEDKLFVLYAQIQSEDPSARLAFLDKLGKGLQHRAPLDFARGQLAWRQGDLPMAEQAFEASLADQPNGQTYESLAQVYRAQGRHELELKTLQGLTEVVRDWPSMQSLPSSTESRSDS